MIFFMIFLMIHKISYPRVRVSIRCLRIRLVYSSIPAHTNWQIEIAVWNLAGFLHCALETRRQRFGQFLHDFLNDFLNDFVYENLNLLYEKS